MTYLFYGSDRVLAKTANSEREAKEFASQNPKFWVKIYDINAEMIDEGEATDIFNEKIV